MMFKLKGRWFTALAEKKKKPKKIPDEVKKDLERRLKKALKEDKSHTKKLKS